MGHSWVTFSPHTFLRLSYFFHVWYARQNGLETALKMPTCTAWANLSSEERVWKCGKVKWLIDATFDEMPLNLLGRTKMRLQYTSIFLSFFPQGCLHYITKQSTVLDSAMYKFDSKVKDQCLDHSCIEQPTFTLFQSKRWLCKAVSHGFALNSQINFIITLH